MATDDPLTKCEIRKLQQFTHSVRCCRAHEDAKRNAGVTAELDVILAKLDEMERNVTDNEYGALTMKPSEIRTKEQGQIVEATKESLSRFPDLDGGDLEEEVQTILERWDMLHIRHKPLTGKMRLKL